MRSFALLGFFLCLVVGSALVLISVQGKPKLKYSAITKDKPAEDADVEAGAPTSKTPKVSTDSDFTADSRPLHPSLRGLEKQLVRFSNGATAPMRQDDGKVKYVLVYFSAHWCGPCCAFTPQLVNFHQSYSRMARNKGIPFEIVFISLDHSENDMNQYAYEMSMPWLAVKYPYARTNPLFRYCGQGIPCLVLLGPKGEVVSDGTYGAQHTLNEIQRIINQG